MELYSLINNKLFSAVLLLILSSTIPALAESKELNTSKLIEAYRKYYEKAISADLFASKAEEYPVRDKRKKIYLFLKNKNLKFDNELLEKRWQTYLRSNYSSKKDFEKKLEQNYLSANHIKNKFFQNQYLEEYFNSYIVPQIKTDIELRQKLFEIARLENLKLDSKELEEQSLQYIENLTGEDQYNSFLASKLITKNEIEFYVATDIYKNLLVEKLSQEQIDKDAKLNQELKKLAKIYHKNFNSEQSPNYYFIQAFISKNEPEAEQKIQKAQESFIKSSKISKTIDIAAEIQVTSMSEPANHYSELYLREIREAVSKLSKSDLFLSKEISPVIKTAYGYHVFQLKAIEVSETVSYNDSLERVISKIKQRKSKDIDEFINKYKI